MNLRDVSAGDEVGFVAGIVDRPITEHERADGFVGHTVDEWLAYNNAAQRHPLKNNHGEIVGRLLHTYVDHKHNLCATALLDRAHESLWSDVRAGTVHAFSIGFDAVYDGAPDRPYKNKDFEVSLTSTPRKPFATIQVRCSEMADPSTAPPSTPAPVAPSSAASAPPMPAAADAASPAMDLDLIRQTEELRAKAAQWDAYQRAEQERVYAEQRSRLAAVMPVLRETGMDVDNEGQQQVLEVLARTPQTAALLQSMQKLAEERATLRAEKDALAEKERAAAAAAAEAANANQRNIAFMEQLRAQFGGAAAAGGEAKRASVTPAAWNTTAPAELAPHQALAAGLGSIDASLFQRAAAAAAANANTVAPVPAAPAAVAPPVDDPRLEMPKTAEDRARLACRLLLMDQPSMSVAVRCSDDSEDSGQQIAQRFVQTHRDTFAAQLFNKVPPILWQLGLGDTEHWKRLGDDLVGAGEYIGTMEPVRPLRDEWQKDLMSKKQRPAWDGSAAIFDSLFPPPSTTKAN